MRFCGKKYWMRYSTALPQWRSALPSYHKCPPLGFSDIDFLQLCRLRLFCTKRRRPHWMHTPKKNLNAWHQSSLSAGAAGRKGPLRRDEGRRCMIAGSIPTKTLARPSGRGKLCQVILWWVTEREREGGEGGGRGRPGLTACQFIAVIRARFSNLGPSRSVASLAFSRPKITSMAKFF